MPIVVHDVVYVNVEWIEKRQWRRILGRKAGTQWIPDDPDRSLHMDWLRWAPLGEMKHAEEDLWIEIVDRVGNEVLVANYILQCYQALRLSVASKPTVDVNELD